MRCTLEEACWLWLGCWSHNGENSHLGPGPFNSRVLHFLPDSSLEQISSQGLKIPPLVSQMAPV